MTDVVERGKAAHGRGIITKEELERLQKVVVHDSDISICPNCLSGKHYKTRHALMAKHKKWEGLLDFFKKLLACVNAHLKDFDLERRLLCYMESSQDEEFAKHSIYNDLQPSKMKKMLNGLRYAAPFVDLRNKTQTQHLSMEDRQLAAIIKLIEIRHEISIELRVLVNKAPAKVQEALKGAPLNEAEVLISAVASTFEGDPNAFDELQAKLPPNLRVSEENMESVRRTFINVNEVGKGGKKGFQAAFSGTEDEKKLESRKRLEKTWGIKDKNGKLWRWKAGRFRRLSVVRKVVRAFNGSVHVHEQVKTEHPPEPLGFAPPLDEEFQKTYNDVLKSTS